jgi:branched-chain amino acid aminotransferase
MNMYFVFADGHIVTPETGTILEGITRSSVIDIAGKLGHQVEERKFSIDEWRDGVASGEITEIFACGTAAVVTPVGTLRWAGGETAAPASTDLTIGHKPHVFGPDRCGWGPNRMHCAPHQPQVDPAGNLAA